MWNRWKHNYRALKYNEPFWVIYSLFDVLLGSIVISLPMTLPRKIILPLEGCCLIVHVSSNVECSSGFGVQVSIFGLLGLFPFCQHLFPPLYNLSKPGYQLSEEEGALSWHFLLVIFIQLQPYWVTSWVLWSFHTFCRDKLLPWVSQMHLPGLLCSFSSLLAFKTTCKIPKPF